MITCNRSRNKTASCASPVMNVVHQAGVPYAAIVISLKGGTGDAKPVDLKATGTSWARSTCTLSPMVKWCRFLNASRIYVREVSGVVVARARATGRIRLVGVVLQKHGIKHRRMFVRAPWSMPINRVIRQEAYPL